MGSDTKPKVAYVYDEDEEGRRVLNTKKSAKQRSSKSQSGKPEERRQSKSDTGPQHEAMMSGANGGIIEKLLERRKSTSSKSPKKSHSRPPSSHRIGLPPLAIPVDHPAYFGIGTPVSAARAPQVAAQYTYPVVQSLPLRPLPVSTQTYPNSRPLSFHATNTSHGYGTGPPMSVSAYYPTVTPSYPPQSPSSSFMRQEYFPQAQVAHSVRPLLSRFESPTSRPSSAFGMREVNGQQQLQDAYEDGYASATEAPRRRHSIREPSGQTQIRSRREVDTAAMPPPARPQGILRNRTTEYYADTTLDPPRESRTIYHDEPAPRRSSVNRHSGSYDRGDQVRETANTSHRRQSYYGPSPTANSGSGSGYEDKLGDAARYQEDVGGSSLPLSAESLRKLQRRQAGSSRSTKSSGSRDESDYRKSATTHTSQSGRGQDEDFTIKVKGGPARIMVGNAQIDCAEGGEIEVKRQKSIRNGSERSNSIYGDDRKSRTDRPFGRSRTTSHSGRSYDRPTPQYAPPGYF